MKRILILIGCALTLAAQAEPLGRLFHTPEQRALLDNARKTMPMNTSIESEAAPTAPDFTLKGIVTRSDGKRSIWVNNHVEYDAAQPSAQDRNKLQVQLPNGEVKLKVGQRIDPATGQVTESFRHPSPGPAIAKPTPPKAPTPPDVSKTRTPKTHDEDADLDKPATQ